MHWLEVSVVTNPGPASAVEEILDRHGHGGAVVETPIDCFENELLLKPLPDRLIVKAYLPLDGDTERRQMALESELLAVQEPGAATELIVRQLAEEDWTEAWKQQYRRLRVGQRLVIVPAWEVYEAVAGEIAIRLEPGMAFGTGLHATTRLCLQALETCMTPGASVLDVGTGSGILAIAAAHLGAESVLALDSDPVAVVVARQNVEANDVAGQVTVQRGSLPGGDGLGGQFETASGLDLLRSGLYDLLLVNILAPVIAGMAPALAARIGRGSRLIAAGLIESQEDEIVHVLSGERLRIIHREQEEDWVCLVVQKE